MTKNPLMPQKAEKLKMVEMNKSAGILDDFAVRKNVATGSGTIEKVPINNSDIVNKLYVDGNFLKLDGSNSSGVLTFGSPAPYEGLRISNNGPSVFMLTQLDSGDDMKNWYWDAEGDVLYFGALNDALTVGSNYARVLRSGIGILEFDLLWDSGDGRGIIEAKSTECGITTNLLIGKREADVNYSITFQDYYDNDAFIEWDYNNLTLNFNRSIKPAGYQSSDGSTGISATITTAKLTPGGANGSMTFKNGILTAQTAAT